MNQGDPSHIQATGGAEIVPAATQNTNDGETLQPNQNLKATPSLLAASAVMATEWPDRTFQAVSNESEPVITTQGQVQVQVSTITPENNIAGEAEASPLDGDQEPTAGVRRGRFFVTTNINPTENELAENEDEKEHASVPSDIRKKGRFVVFTELDQDTDHGQEQGLGLGQSLEHEHLHEQYSPDELSNQPMSAQSMTSIPTRRATYMDSPFTSGADHQRIGGLGKQKQAKEKVAGQARKTNPSILSELQKISLQNRKLHKMLLSLTSPENLPGVETSSSQPASAATTTAAKATPTAKANPMATATSTAVATSSPAPAPAPSRQESKDNTETSNATEQQERQQWPELRAPAPSNGNRNSRVPRLQELFGEMNDCTMQIVTENDELKMRNILLTSELNRCKRQLQEAQSRIESLTKVQQ